LLKTDEVVDLCPVNLVPKWRPIPYLGRRGWRQIIIALIGLHVNCAHELMHAMVFTMETGRPDQ